MSEDVHCEAEKRGHRRRLAAIFLVALAARGLSIGRTSEGAGEIRGDATFYYQSGISLGRRGVLQDEAGARALRMPVYPAFIAAVTRVAGDSVAAVQAAQAVVGSLVCVAIYDAAIGWLGAPAAFGAGMFAAVYYGLSYPCGRLLSECLFAAWLALLFRAWFRFSGRWTDTASAAFFSAALYGTRPEGALAGIALAAFGPWADKRWRARDSAAVFAALGAAGGAWAWRNHGVLGVALPGTTGAAFSLWAALPRTMSENLHAGIGAVPVALVPPMAHELEWMTFFRGRSLAVLAAAPKFLVLKAALFNLVSQFYPFLPRYEVTFAWLAPFWLYAFRTRRRDPNLRPALLLMAAWAGLYVVFGGADSRLRQLYAPLLIWLGAAGLYDLSRDVETSRFRQGVAAWTALNLFVWWAAPWARAAALKLKAVL